VVGIGSSGERTCFVHTDRPALLLQTSSLLFAPTSLFALCKVLVGAFASRSHPSSKQRTSFDSLYSALSPTGFWWARQRSLPSTHSNPVHLCFYCCTFNINFEVIIFSVNHHFALRVGNLFFKMPPWVNFEPLVQSVLLEARSRLANVTSSRPKVVTLLRVGDDLSPAQLSAYRYVCLYCIALV